VRELIPGASEFLSLRMVQPDDDPPEIANVHEMVPDTMPFIARKVGVLARQDQGNRPFLGMERDLGFQGREIHHAELVQGRYAPMLEKVSHIHLLLKIFLAKPSRTSLQDV
jgi:hypothetical protein